MLVSENPIWNELLQTAADMIGECCVNVGTDDEEIYNNMEPFISKDLTDKITSRSSYMRDHYLAWLEGGQGSHADSEAYTNYPFDFGMAADAFGVATRAGSKTSPAQGATLGYDITSQLSRIGILKSQSEIPAIRPDAVRQLLNTALANNGFTIRAATGSPVPAADVKSQIVGVSNMYKFAEVVSEFIYRNVSIFVCPESPSKICYVFKALSEVETGDYGITASLDPANSYFDQLNDIAQRNKMKEYFQETLVSRNFFVRDIKSNDYIIKRTFQGIYR